jgi:hypothetical protein
LEAAARQWAHTLDRFDLTAERGRDGAVDVRTPTEVRAMSEGVDRDQDRRDRDHGEHDVLHESLPSFCSGPFCSGPFGAEQTASSLVRKGGRNVRERAA